VSRENVELVRRTYEVIDAIGRTGSEFVDPEDVAPELWARLDPDFELHDRPDMPDATVYRGREASKEFWRKTQPLFSELRWEPGEFIDRGRGGPAPPSGSLQEAALSSTRHQRGDAKAPVGALTV
jgi:hypothetical protein